MNLRTYRLSEIHKGMRVVMRIDGNVPLKNGRIVRGGDHRLRVLIPELQAIIRRGAELTILTHIGRPDGFYAALSTKPIQRYMKKHVGSGVKVAENLRFNKGEEKDSSRFAKELVKDVDLYINNAFGVCHRKHASVHAVTKYIDIRAGHWLVKEVKQLSKPYRHPSTLIVGGIKMKTKIPVIEHLSDRLDHILTSGGVAVALAAVMTGKRLYAGGHEMTKTEHTMAQDILLQFGDQVHVPIDFRVSRKKTIGKLTVKHVSDLRSGDRLFDIGPATEKEYQDVIKQSRTIVWNGPMGLVEERAAAKGTHAIAQRIAQKRWARKIVGGGDTVSFLDKHNLTEKFSFVSTGGGAMLAFLGGKKMPGLEVLQS